MSWARPRKVQAADCLKRAGACSLIRCSSADTLQRSLIRCSAADTLLVGPFWRLASLRSEKGSLENDYRNSDSLQKMLGNSKNLSQKDHGFSLGINFIL